MPCRVYYSPEQVLANYGFLYCQSSFIETKSHAFIVSCLWAASALQRQIGIVAAETLWPAKPIYNID